MLVFLDSVMIDLKLGKPLENIQKYPLPFQLKQQSSVNWVSKKEGRDQGNQVCHSIVIQAYQACLSKLQ